LEKTDMTYGLARVDGSNSSQGELPPAALLPGPVQRRLPAVLLHRLPTERQPQFGALIATRLHEFQVFAAGHQSRGQSMGGAKNLMPWQLVIEPEWRGCRLDLRAECFIRGSDPLQALLSLDPSER